MSDSANEVRSRKLPIGERVTTTITLPRETADELKAMAKRAGIGWTQMAAVLIRQGLDTQGGRAAP